jgi:hypothetical protein
MARKISFEEQEHRIRSGIDLFLRVIGALSALGAIAYSAMMFYIETKANDQAFKQDIVLKGEEIKTINEQLNANFTEHRILKEKMSEIHMDVKIIKALIENKRIKDKAKLAITEATETYQFH